WCVLFPPLCLPAAEKREELLSDVLTAKEIKLVSAKPEYEVRFWIAEKLQEIKNSYKTKG
ncbi:MAG: stage II sporulation protein R, partial [Clostridia bacterium]|nr:stage II sporulation protein R [Clostridia bacterium]